MSKSSLEIMREGGGKKTKVCETVRKKERVYET